MERPQPLFGVNIDPGTADPDDAFARAELADREGIDLALIQDHPYIDRFFDTWMLLATVAARTERVHVGTNVSPLALRPPTMIAKAAASLDVLSGGRVELGIGTGGFAQGIASFGGKLPEKADIVPAFDEAVRIIRGLWQSENGFRFEGSYYNLRGTRFGPATGASDPYLDRRDQAAHAATDRPTRRRRLGFKFLRAGERARGGEPAHR